MTISTPPDEEPRWRRRKDARPAELLRAALDLFVEQGFAATRIESIAKRAGVSKGTVYLYYPSKEALLAAVVGESTGPLLAEVAALMADGSRTATDVIRAVTLLWVERFESAGATGLPKLIYAESSNFPEIARAYLTQADKARALFEALIQRGIDAGEFRPVDLQATARAYLGGIIFAMIYRHALGPLEDGRYDFERAVEGHIQLALAGLKATGPMPD
ncbi:MAG: TetR/AcrR family transcriptional regulator [Myxococcales bacterium]|nr:TetR/AcrR family transcriptional regulator [Myxococcales bacterium]